MFGLIMKLIKHLESKGDLTGILICHELGDMFIKETKEVLNAEDRRIFKSLNNENKIKR